MITQQDKFDIINNLKSHTTTTVYENQKIVMLNTISPEDILDEGHQSELKTYKGVLISKTHADKDIFKINLLDSLRKQGYVKLTGILFLTLVSLALILYLVLK